MSERAQWFRCDPSRLLGALSGMEPDCGYVYTIVLLRIYEVGGPIYDDERVLARRAGLSTKRVATAVAWLVAHGKVERLPDGSIDSVTTHDELAFREKCVIDARNAGKESAKRKLKFGAKKNQQKQQPAPTPVEPPLNGRATGEQRPSTELESDIEVANATSKSALPALVKADPRSILLTCLSPEVADGVIAHRKAKKAPLTALAAKELVKGFQSTADPDDAARVMVARGWQGFELSWYENHKGGSNGSGRPRTVQDAARDLRDAARAGDLSFAPRPGPLLPPRRD